MTQENTEQELLEGLLQQAEIKMDSNDFKSAVRIYDQIIQKFPQDAWTYWERGVARKHKGDLDGAMNDFNRCIELDDSNQFAYALRGQLKLMKKDSKGAEQDFYKADELKKQFLLNNPYQKTKVKEKRNTNINFLKDGRSGYDFQAT